LQKLSSIKKSEKEKAREKSCSQPTKDFEAQRREQIRKFEELVDTFAEPEEVK
jgi:hypothetical protein